MKGVRDDGGITKGTADSKYMISIENTWKGIWEEGLREHKRTSNGAERGGTLLEHPIVRNRRWRITMGSSLYGEIGGRRI